MSGSMPKCSLANQAPVRLGDKGGNQFRPLALNVLLEIVRAVVGIGLLAHAQRIAVADRAGDEACARNAGLGNMPRAQPIGDRKRPHGGPMIGIPSRNDLVRARLGAAVNVILLGELERGLHRLRPAAHIHHMVEPPRCQRCELRRQPHRRLDEIVDCAHIVHAHQLPMDGVGDFRLPIAQ